jgi:hypothetical protein
MWQAYYNGDSKTLGRELIGLLREQFGLSRLEAVEVARDLAKATWTFRQRTGGYERHCLPPLESAYRKIKEATGADWEAQAAARAELGWWVARRTPSQDSPEQVGEKIAELYAVLYGTSNPYIDEAGQLRARAAQLRDEGGTDGCDWDEIERLLLGSYRSLLQGIW